MPAVMIHGVPDTYHVWEPVRQHLSRKDVVALRLPGFGAPISENFSATKETYVEWIISQLEGIGEPVDLVGHDWGCILTMRVVSLRPDLIRSWAAGSGPVSRSYEWHPLAKIWQTPAEGEKWMRDLKAVDIAGVMTQAGLPADAAQEAAARIDESMKQCILRLYRSAVHVGQEWQPDLSKIQKPGMVFWGQRDAACPVKFAEQLGHDAGTRQVHTFNSEHWVIVERSLEIARALEAHWASVN